MLRASLQKCTMAAGKSSCNIYILSHSMGMGRGDGQKPGDVRPASPMQARSQQLLTHMAKDRVANVLEGERGKYLVLSPKKRRYLQQWAVYVDGGQGTERFWYQLPNQAWDIPCAVMPSHAAGFPRALARPPLSPGICAGNVGEKFSESRRNPAAGCPRRHPGTSLPPRGALTQRVVPRSQPGTSHGTCRKFTPSVEVCGLLRGQEL